MRERLSSDDVRADAAAFAELFPALYLRFHRRDAKRGGLTGAARGVMLHLSQSGPLTIGEAARHLRRAQSVVSELVDRLVQKGLLERVPDARDRRRVLVWLTEEGVQHLETERDVLGRPLVERAMARMSADDRAALLRGVRALLVADMQSPPGDVVTHPERRRTR
jgi:DNA-binding MarR family transcriptional regulator